MMSCLHISRLKELLLLLSILSLHHTPEISLTSLSAAVSFKRDTHTHMAEAPLVSCLTLTGYMAFEGLV